MSTFKTFFSSVGSNKPMENTNDQWDVILFSGEYNPITRDEHNRIKKFIKEYVVDGPQASKFSKNVEFGLICNDESSPNSIVDKFKYKLTNEEKEYLTAKLFGLRMFPLNFRDILSIANDVEMYDDKKDAYRESINKIKKSFQKANILIVLNKMDIPNKQAIDEIVKKFSDEDISIGFIIWGDDTKNTPIDFLGNQKMSGDIIKAIVLLDFERPNPEEIKSFCYKYKLADILDIVRTIHFKVMGEKYLLAFRALFPDLIIFGDEEEDDKDNNYIFIMELLKKMYLRDAYQNRIADRQEKASNTVSKNIKLLPMEGGGGGSGGAPAGGGGSPGGDMGGDEGGGEEVPVEDGTDTSETPEPQTESPDEGF
jgi:hypothetical protein